MGDDLFAYIRANRDVSNIPWPVRARYPEYLRGKDLARYKREMREQAKADEEARTQNCIDSFF